jgi:cytochrome oxidase Cu insertion factor (SCO1/SenC/PrrC family)
MRLGISVAMVAFAAWPGAAIAAETTPPAPEPPGAAAARAYFPDVVLVDQSGRELRFQSELIEGKTVVLGSFFTECSEHCPAQLATWARVAKALGPRMERDVRFVAVSVRPSQDTPARLGAFAASVGATPGWYFVTGEPAAINLVAAKLDLRPEAPGTHSGTWWIGNVRSGLWKKASAEVSAEELLAAIEACLQDK